MSITIVCTLESEAELFGLHYILQLKFYYHFIITIVAEGLALSLSPPNLLLPSISSTYLRWENSWVNLSETLASRMITLVNNPLNKA